MIIEHSRETKVVDLQAFAARQGKKLRFLPALGMPSDKNLRQVSGAADTEPRGDGPEAA